MKFLFVLTTLSGFTAMAADLSSYYGVKQSSTSIAGAAVKCTEEYTSYHLNIHARNFLSISFPIGKMKEISCSEGLILTGTLSFKDGKKFNPSNPDKNKNLQVNPQSSSTKIEVPTTSEVVFELPVHFEGEVNGNKVHLTFEDSAGKIILEGEIGPNDEGTLVFSAPFQYSVYPRKGGDEEFQNPSHTHSHGEPVEKPLEKPLEQPLEGIIGLFEVPVCEFFDCTEPE